MSQIQNGYTWTNGEICTAAHLNQMLNSATLNAEAVNGQTAVASALADSVLLYQSASGELRQSTVADILQSDGSTIKPSNINSPTGGGIAISSTSGGGVRIETSGSTTDLGITLDTPTVVIGGSDNVTINSATTVTDPTKGNVSITGTRVNLTASGPSGAGEITLTGNVTITGKNNIMPTGCVMLFANASVPSGWAKCNGVAVSRTSSTYHDLFLAIGTIYGSGDGVNTFNLPDLRGEFVRGWDDGRGVDTGRAIGSHQDQQLEKHKHIASNNDCQSYASINGIGTGSYNTWCDSSGSATNSSAALTGDGSHTEQTAKLGTETRPRNTAMMYCIKL